MTTINWSLIRRNPRLFLYDVTLITIMAVLAACGLIYQYLLSHYAGRVLGVMEHTIYAMIGVMIVSMGVGAFAARLVKCPFSGFAWLEAVIAFFGATGILLIAGAFALAAVAPEVIARNFGLPPDLVPVGGVFRNLTAMAEVFPYLIGFIIGMLVGMEIPFIARVREGVYGDHLEHNIGTLYGADYIGAGIGAAIFVAFMLAASPEKAAILTAAANLLAGLAFFFLSYRRIKFAAALFLVHLILGLVLVALYAYAGDWHATLEDTLYQDRVILSRDTDFQHITLTKRMISPERPPIYTFYINGRNQFSSGDEQIYHAMLVGPAMLASARRDNVLVVGGGDGLALRDVLTWSPRKVTVLELDREVVSLFKEPHEVDGAIINQPLLDLNRNAFDDPRVRVTFGDAFNTVDGLIADGHSFDVIIVDLPDPSHPDLNKLYSIRFYAKLRQLLAGDGAMVIQSTSPYHARDAFLTVGVTLRQAGLDLVERYHQNVPSFGEWGWTIATKAGARPSERIRRTAYDLPPGNWATKELLLASFVFPARFLDGENLLEPNRLGSHIMYLLHQQAWQSQQDFRNE
ncbi:MAG: polyamine aminopropyltransferase [Sphingomonadales bacterium]